MRYLIIGQTGQLARALIDRAGGRSVELEVLGRERLDLADTGAIRDAVVQAHKLRSINAVINAAAYTAVDKAEDEADLAFKINGDAPRVIAEACGEISVPLLHVSTDYVFDGNKSGAYTEDDATDPQNVYGRSKLAGEIGVRETLERHLIVRTSWVYSAEGQNFLRTMLTYGAERDVLRVVDDQRGCPTAAPDLADALLTITDHAAAGGADANVYGTYHFAGSGAATWCDFAREIFGRSARVRPGVAWARVEAIGTADYQTKASRPANSVLDCSKLARTFGLHPRPWQAALDDVMQSWAENETTTGAHT